MQRTSQLKKENFKTNATLNILVYLLKKLCSQRTSLGAVDPVVPHPLYASIATT